MGVVKEKEITMLVDGGSTQNFIDSSLVERRKLLIGKLEGFTVIIPGNHSMECSRWIPKLQVTIGYYTVTNSFYVVNVADTNMVLGVQWLYSIANNTIGYQVPEMGF